jgi:diguanylate cyclase (GGDEF)-like protein
MNNDVLPMITSSIHIISVVYFALSIPSLYLMAHKKVDSRACQIAIGIFSGLIANYIYKNTLLSSDALLGLTLCPIVLVSLIFGPYALFFGGLVHLLRVVNNSPHYTLFLLSFIALSFISEIWKGRKYTKFLLVIAVSDVFSILLNWQFLHEREILNSSIIRALFSIFFLSLLYVFFAKIIQIFLNIKVLEKRAQTDQLTGLPNRFGIIDHINHMKIGRERFYLSLIDVDFFKTVNDTYGHLTGDKILVEIATLIGDNIRGSDYLGRFGGEEFMLIIDAPDMKTAESTLERLLSTVRSNEFINFEGDRTFRLTISAGVALCEKTCMPDTVINSADAALYKAKEGGRNRVEFGVSCCPVNL